MALGTKSNGISYYIYDRYCMNPNSKCNDVVLHFVENDEAENDKGTEFAILLSLKNKKYEILDFLGLKQKEVDEMVKEPLENSDEANKPMV